MHSVTLLSLFLYELSQMFMRADAKISPVAVAAVFGPQNHINPSLSE